MKNIRKKISSGIGIAILAFPLLALAQSDSKIKEAIKVIFPAFQEYKTEEYVRNNLQLKVFTVLKEHQVLGWAVLLDEMGKIKPITFLVGIDNENRVIEVNVLEYRDIFGSEIRRSSFLRQFKGKSLKDRLSVGGDIDAVTSATISSQAAASAVKKALIIVDKIRNDF